MRCSCRAVTRRAPYDGRTLNAAIEQAERLSGQKIGEVFVDMGYRGHDYEGSAAA